jgi:polysaccharide export outer membrane protein
MTSERLLRLCLALSLATTICVAQNNDHASPNNSKTQQPIDSAATPQFGEREPRYLLRPGDVFDLQFEFSPEYNQTVTVQPDGFVMLRGVGDTHVAGKNIPELTDTLKQAYGKFLAQPVVSVVL